MVEKISTETRSRMMSTIRAKNTKPEIAIRKVIHRLGFRFRIHRNDLPGRPDIVLPKYSLAILVHGCFWHRHPDCPYTTNPKTNGAFWKAKFKENMRRDVQAQKQLHRNGWRTLTIWECATKDPDLSNALPALIRKAVLSERVATEIPRSRALVKKKAHNGR